MPAAEPWFEIDGAEVMSAMRALTYLRRGLGGANFNVGVSVRQGEVGYTDEYADHYSADPYAPVNLSCYCQLIDGGPYVSPADDPAPWYDASRPESAEFLGFYPRVDVLSILSRSITPRSAGGGILGRQYLRPRVVQVSASMFASSAAGMAWGERWLTRALAGDADACGGSVLRLLPACPPDGVDAPSSYLRELAGVALVDGPHFTDNAQVASCFIQSVELQLVAGSPHLRALPEDLVADVALSADPTLCAVLEPSTAAAQAAARIRIRAGIIGSSLNGIVITGTLTTGACPAAGDPTVSYTIGPLRRGTELVIDASTRTVTMTDAATGETVGGLDVVEYEAPLSWLIAEPGEQLCICIDASASTINPGTRLLVEQIDMEL
jgi:hypothetical protein